MVSFLEMWVCWNSFIFVKYSYTCTLGSAGLFQVTRILNPSGFFNSSGHFMATGYVLSRQSSRWRSAEVFWPKDEHNITRLDYHVPCTFRHGCLSLMFRDLCLLCNSKKPTFLKLDVLLRTFALESIESMLTNYHELFRKVSYHFELRDWYQLSTDMHLWHMEMLALLRNLLHPRTPTTQNSLRKINIPFNTTFYLRCLLTWSNFRQSYPRKPKSSWQCLSRSSVGI